MEIQIQAWDLTAQRSLLEGEAAVAKLKRFGITLCCRDDRLLGIPDPDTIIKTVIQGEDPSSAPVQHPKGSPNDGLGNWGERRSRLLRNNPELAQLVSEFLSHVRSEEPGLRLKQNATTITLIDRAGRPCGMYLRRDKIFITCWRNGVAYEGGVSIHSSDDFGAALAYLRNLPPL